MPIDTWRPCLKENPDYTVDPDGTIVRHRMRLENDRGYHPVPRFIGDGVIGKAGEVYVILGDADEGMCKAYRAVELIARAMGKNPEDVRFKDGNARNLKRSNLAFSGEEVAEYIAVHGVPDMPATMAERTRDMRPCPQCGEMVQPIMLQHHIRKRHVKRPPGYEPPPKPEKKTKKRGRKKIVRRAQVVTEKRPVGRPPVDPWKGMVPAEVIPQQPEPRQEHDDE